eukprot:CAMPEP_0181221550 /NCGR_PEP_ID=MMETSP1096-20121128/29471_1 /TAXON_ID=156174 ORGANISM="Chrysochromulina ericina, Strain CCMP281" /NCGR_SAMPLE_ID=MMETSP1096 /ASSEMBLY_ACC=CAM_ASM_000453 /LENGTH=94 /DNA_ID=CAMNT_0023314209 /DNA_START=259 /DNA_END=540 /DNA_ORIENTATION=-
MPSPAMSKDESTLAIASHLAGQSRAAQGPQTDRATSRENVWCRQAVAVPSSQAANAPPRPIAVDDGSSRSTDRTGTGRALTASISSEAPTHPPP